MRRSVTPIDFDNKLINVEQSMKAGTSNIGTTKSTAGMRRIPIPDKLYKELIELKKTTNSPVFTQLTIGKRHTIESMRCLWENFKRTLDIYLGAKLYRDKIFYGSRRYNCHVKILYRYN